MGGKAKEKQTRSGAYWVVIKALRDSLELTQAGLGRALGVSVTTVARWEGGRNPPEQLSILRMLELCGDDATRREFAVRFEAARRAEVGEDSPTLRAPEEAVLRDHSDAATGINILYEMALAGNPGAAEELRNLAATINKRAGDWRRMKYLKKGRG